MNSLQVIVEGCSTTDCLIRCYVIRPEKILSSKADTIYDDEENNIELVYFPVLHRKKKKLILY